MSTADEMNNLRAENALLRGEIKRVSGALEDFSKRFDEICKQHVEAMQKGLENLAKVVASHEALREALKEAIDIANRYINPRADRTRLDELQKIAETRRSEMS